MSSRKCTLALSASAAVTVAAALSPAPAFAATASATTATSVSVHVIASGLDGPRELQFIGGHRLVVAESDSGEISGVDTRSGAVRTLVSGLTGPQGVDARAGQLYLVTGEAAPDAPPPPPGAGPGATLFSTPYSGGTATKLADLKAYELAHNPDGQAQTADDALSNPYYVLAATSRLLVADAAGNDILKVDRKTGAISTFAVLPNINTGACKDAPNNDAQHPGCDAVPTGIAQGPDGYLYVSGLSALTPGEGRIYKLDPNSGAIVRTWSGLSAPTGVAVGSDGSVYASELLYGAPEGDGPPPADFDPSKIGRIVKISASGARTYAQVTQPAGLLWHGGQLYASAGSVYGEFLGIPHAGQVVTVPQAMFQPAT